MIEKIAHIDPRQITDINQLQEMMVLVINVCDQMHTALQEAQTEIQSLKDEINILKGEQEKPKFPGPPASKQPLPGTGPEKPTGKRGNHKRGGKKGRIKIDRVEMVTLPASDLPEDAVLKEYKEYIQQDLRLQRDNVKYRVAVYYSLREGRTYRARMPENYQGAFGAGLISLTQLLSGGADVTQGRIEALFESLGIEISSGTISNIITKRSGWAVDEQDEILRQGIACSPFTQVDGTKSVERGKTMATQIICSDKFSVFLTMPGKSRLDVLAALQGKPTAGLSVCFNASSVEFMEMMAVSHKAQGLLDGLLTKNQPLLLTELMVIVNEPAHGFNKYNRVRIAHALALSHYKEQGDYPVVNWLLSDDAGEYTKVARQRQALCWIHDARYYRKLIPYTDAHKKIHRNTLDEYWTFYDRLKKYRGLMDLQRVAQKQSLSQEFDRLFKRETDYYQVNECLKRTYQNKNKLLAVLENPALPLHNNAAERGARRVVRKRDISLHTWSEQGTRVRDAFLTIVETAAKLGVNALAYIEDRVGGDKKMVSLADRIQAAYAEY
jgi:hypothetical protein